MVIRVRCAGHAAKTHSVLSPVLSSRFRQYGQHALGYRTGVTDASTVLACVVPRNEEVADRDPGRRRTGWATAERNRAEPARRQRDPKDVVGDVAPAGAGEGRRRENQHHLHRCRGPGLFAARPAAPPDLAARPRGQPMGADRRARRAAEPRRHREHLQPRVGRRGRTRLRRAARTRLTTATAQARNPRGGAGGSSWRIGGGSGRTPA
jgi:hypothetical protein